MHHVTVLLYPNTPVTQIFFFVLGSHLLRSRKLLRDFAALDGTERKQKQYIRQTLGKSLVTYLHAHYVMPVIHPDKILTDSVIQS